MFVNFDNLNFIFNLDLNSIYLIIFIIFLGILAGTITGLFPGIHVNLVAFFVLVYFNDLKGIFKDDFLLVLFLLVMGLTHTFLDFIPSILFGIVDETSSVSLLPSQKLLFDRKGIDALYYSAYGSLLGGFISIFLGIFLFLFLKELYAYFSNWIVYFLIFIVLILILTENSILHKFWAFIVVLLSSSIGYLILNSNFIQNPLLILFIGLFSLPNLFDILKKGRNNKTDVLMKQKFYLDNEFLLRGYFEKLKNFLRRREKKESLVYFSKVLKSKNFLSIYLTSFISVIGSISPGMTSSISALISSLFVKRVSNEFKVLLISMVNTINFVISIFVFYLIEKSRNGLVLSISNFYSFSIKEIFFIFFIFLVLILVLRRWMFFLGVYLLKRVKDVNIFYFYFVLFVFLIVFVFYVEGLFGVLYLFDLFFLGYLVYFLNIKKVVLMSSLIVPIILFLI